ncbi:MAG TPA: endoglucanase A, partial [Polyangiaceae bacterium]|nr:endoglucanase A [Polyangiaceae bacterium]
MKTATLWPWMAALLLACGPDAGGMDAGLDDAASGADAGLDASARDAGGGATDAGQRDAGVRLEPGSPGPSDVQVEVDTFADVHAISPLIYGINGAAESTPHPEHYAFFRSGGNRMTAYNWENNASNAGADYFHQNDAFLGGGDTPGEVPRSFVADTISRGVSLVTIPIIGYVAADTLGDGDVGGTPDFLNTRFRRSHANDPSGPSEIPVTDDAEVYQDGMVQLLESRFSSMRAGEHRGVHYSLDNEPDLWAATHPRLRGGDGSLALTYDELWTRTVEYASMVREVAPSAL